MPARLVAGLAAATLEVISAQTGLRQNVLRKAMAVDKTPGVYEAHPLPWGLLITIVEWQEVLRCTPAPLE